MRRAPLLAALTLALTASAPALAATTEADGFHLQGGLFDTAVHERHWLITASIGFPWGSAPGFPIGVEGRAYIPLVKEGFIPTLNDEFGLEFGLGAGLGFGYFGFGMSFGFDIPIHAMWMFHLTPDWSVYATLGLAVHIWFWPGVINGIYSSPVWPEGGVGALWKVAPGWTLRAELGYGFWFGVTWPI